MNNIHGDGGHYAVLRTLPLSGSLNKRINDSLTLVQSPIQNQIITLYQMGFVPVMLYRLLF